MRQIYLPLAGRSIPSPKNRGVRYTDSDFSSHWINQNRITHCLSASSPKREYRIIRLLLSSLSIEQLQQRLDHQTVLQLQRYEGVTNILMIKGHQELPLYHSITEINQLSSCPSSRTPLGIVTLTGLEIACVQTLLEEEIHQLCSSVQNLSPLSAGIRKRRSGSLEERIFRQTPSTGGYADKHRARTAFGSFMGVVKKKAEERSGS